MADWAELHSDVVALIAGRLKEFEDFLAFGGVCRPWKSAATKDNFNSSSIPWLMLAEKKGEAFREFYSLSRSKIVTRILPEAAGKVCYASQGWLITVSQEDLGMNLLHPISRIQIPLPDPKTLLLDEPDCGSELQFFYESFIQRAVLSSSPNSTGGGDYSLCVMYGNQSGLAIWRSAGDFSWTKILPLKACFCDVFYNQGKFLAIREGWTSNGIILVIDAQDPTSNTEIILENFVSCCASNLIIDKLYLVECGGKWLVIVRQGVRGREPKEKELEELEEERIRSIDFGKDLETYGTLYFRVFKLHLDLNSISSCVIGDTHWEEVHDLGRRALFLGHNSSFCIDIDASNESIKPDSIYFTDDAWESYLEPPGPNWLAPEGGGKDMGIYSLKDKTIMPHFQGKSYCRLTPPIWIQPTF